MKIKLFQIRLADEFVQLDQDLLNDFLDSVILKKSTTELVLTEPKYWSVFLYYEDSVSLLEKIRKNKFAKPISGELLILPQNKKSEKFKDIVEMEMPLTLQEISRLESLKLWRNEIATRLNLPSYMVTSNATLLNVTMKNPQSLEELINIKGLGPNKIGKYGADIVALLNYI